MKYFIASIVAAAGLWSSSALADTTECTEISSLPAVITAQGVYCLKKNLVTSITSGAAIEIQANNVTIDLNSWKLGGSAGGPAAASRGIRASSRNNITIRNGTIRGFENGILFDGGSGHLVEYIRADGNHGSGIHINSINSVVRYNHVVNTGDGDVGAVARGINLLCDRNCTVGGNIIDGLSESSQVWGIAVLCSTGPCEVRGNSIFGLNTATTQYGINILDGTNVAIIENQIINDSGATTAINASGGGTTGIDCIENVVRGYTTAFSGCDYSSGNHVN